MPIREKRTISGDLMEVGIYPISNKEKKKKRRKKTMLSTPRQRDLNDKNAKRQLLRLLEINFTSKDLILHATYADEHLPATREEGEKNARNLLRRIKYHWKKQGLGELKYISVLEHSEGEEDGEVTRLHHHIVISGGMDRDFIESLWKYGTINTRRLQPKKDTGLAGLANYLSKSKKRGKRSYIPSKNLEKPIVLPPRDSKYTKRKIEQIATLGRDSRIYFEQQYPNYHFIDCQIMKNEEWGTTSLYIVMRRIRN